MDYSALLTSLLPLVSGIFGYWFKGWSMNTLIVDIEKLKNDVEKVWGLITPAVSAIAAVTPPTPSAPVSGAPTGVAAPSNG